MLWIDGITRAEALEMVRNANLDDLERWLACLPQEKVPNYKELVGEDYSVEPYCIRLCLLVWIASQFTQIPKLLQLKASLAFLHKKDSLLYAGTGFGKTLIIVMANILENASSKAVTITISPLKRLQQSQSQLFWEHYGIFTLAINEDTLATMSDSDWNASAGLTHGLVSSLGARG
ncbi:hypothetical protein D9611_009450 [Ephemerocybe angulata]|uniref:DEAD/DEAH-box helicase domain-containing protein n=1 Tax=Ephemerocybe angulata TaxID=980116 RepID=A0A8H5AVH3_9AGAR|nr:hypothetical protein D9611_009450 [Tulosesus angulatus]